MDLVVIVAEALGGVGPSQPIRLGVCQGLFWVDGLGERIVGREPRQDERHTPPGFQRELGHRGEALAAHLDRGSVAERVRPGDGEPRVVDAAHPWNDAAVAKADHQFRTHGHTTLEPLDDSDDLRTGAAR